MSVALARRASDAVLPVCIAAMDGCWLYIAGSLFHAVVLSGLGVPSVPSPIVLALLQLAAWWLVAYLLDGTTLPMTTVQVLSGAAGLVISIAVHVALNPPANGDFSPAWYGGAVYPIGVALIPWLVGGYRASERQDFNGAYFAFRVGLIIIGSATLMASIIRPQSIESSWIGLGGVLIWFFVWALAALAIGNRQLLNEEYGGMSMGGWGAVFALSLGAVLVVAFLGGAANLVALVDLAFTIIVGIVGLLVVVLYLLLDYFLVMASRIIGLIATILESLGWLGPPTQREGQQAQEAGPQYTTEYLERLRRELESGNLVIPPELLRLVAMVGAVVLVVAAVLLVTRMLRRTRRSMERHASEERESFGSWAMLVQQVRNWLKKLLGRGTAIEGAARGGAEDDLTALQGRSEWSGTLSVRQIYTRLQMMAGTAGYPRATSQTPLEYLTVLSSALPDLRYDLQDITSAYLEARYGPLPASDPAVRAATQAWSRAEPVLKGLGARGRA